MQFKKISRGMQKYIKKYILLFVSLIQNKIKICSRYILALYDILQFVSLYELIFFLSRSIEKYLLSVNL